MNEFFAQVVLENPLSNYLWVGGVIVAAFLFKQLLSRYIAGIVYRTLWKKALRIDKRQFLALVEAPLQRFLLVVIFIAALETLHYPQKVYTWQGFSFTFDFRIYNVTFHHLLEVAGVLLVIGSFIWLLLRCIDFVALLLEHRANQTADLGDNQLIVFFKDFFKVLLVLIGVLAALRFGFKMPIGNLITGLSLVGAAIALATRESLENLIASFIIFFDRPFTTGDLVKVHQISGTVEKIGLRSTRIRTDQKTYVTVPNKQMVDSIMDNLSLRSHRRGFIQLDILGTTPIEKVQHFMEKVRGHLQSLGEVVQHSQVHLTDIQRHTMIVEIEYLTPPVGVEQFNQVREQINVSILSFLQEDSIALAAKENK